VEGSLEEVTSETNPKGKVESEGWEEAQEEWQDTWKRR
jgi:hypothetical protein